jgi:uncharacterized repeat protein (TIGR03803 family)
MASSIDQPEVQMLTHPPIPLRTTRAALVASASMLLAFAAVTNPAHATSGYSILYTFQGTPDGSSPYGQQVRDKKGNIYGVTLVGGAYNEGAVYELSPGKRGSAWTKQSVYDFPSGFGSYGSPSGYLIADRSGNLWGTAFGGGANNGGVLFELTPPAQQGQSWTFTDVYDFPQWATLAGSGASAFVFDPQGDVFGLYEFGSPYVGCEQNGCGRLYELTPPVGGNGPWTETDLYTFPTTNGNIPYTLARKGNSLYGITTFGGTMGWGSVWEARPNRKSGQWQVSDVYDFCSVLDQYGDCADGQAPEGGLVFDKNGNVYGTTYQGGPGFWNGALNSAAGTVFQLAAPQSKGDAWTYTLLRAFYPNLSTDQNGVYDGGDPAQTLTLDKSGNVYGTTSTSGTATDGGNATGTVFSLAAGTWAETNLHTFGDRQGASTDLRYPSSPLTRDSKGNIYGTTQYGISNEYGGAFELTQ